MALDADALAALANFGKNLSAGSEGESGGEDKSATAPEFAGLAEGDSASNADTSSESIPPAWESFPSDLEVVTALLAAVSAETGEKQESLLPQTKLIDDLDFDDLSLYAVVAQLEAVLKEKRSDNEIAECKSLGEMALLYVSSNKRTN